MAVNPHTTARKLVSLPHATVQEIQDYRFDNRIKSEAEAIRRLIGIGLAAGPILSDLLSWLEATPLAHEPDVQTTIRQLREALGQD